MGLTGPCASTVGKYRFYVLQTLDMVTVSSGDLAPIYTMGLSTPHYRPFKESQRKEDTVDERRIKREGCIPLRLNS